jgi:hypothetical protein
MRSSSSSQLQTSTQVPHHHQQQHLLQVWLQVVQHTLQGLLLNKQQQQQQRLHSSWAQVAASLQSHLQLGWQLQGSTQQQQQHHRCS